MTALKKPKGFSNGKNSVKKSKKSLAKKSPAGTQKIAKPSKTRSKTKTTVTFEEHERDCHLASDKMLAAKTMHDAARQRMHFEDFTCFPSEHCPPNQVFCNPNTIKTLKAICDYSIAAFNYIKAFESNT